MLTQRQVVEYLLHRKLLNPAAAVDGDLSIEDVSRRNCNFKVVSAAGPSYLVKQGISPDGIATVAREAAVYRLLQPGSEIRKTDLPRYLPQVYEYDQTERVLVLELSPNGKDLRSFYTSRPRFSTALGSEMGGALSALHRWDQDGSRLGLSLAGDVPGVFSIHRPTLAFLRELNEANLQLIKAIQQSTELCQFLNDVSQGWCSDRLIHRDIKLDNWIQFCPSARSRSRLKLVL